MPYIFVITLSATALLSIRVGVLKKALIHLAYCTSCIGHHSGAPAFFLLLDWKYLGLPIETHESRIEYARNANAG